MFSLLEIRRELPLAAAGTLDLYQSVALTYLLLAALVTLGSVWVFDAAVAFPYTFQLHPVNSGWLHANDAAECFVAALASLIVGPPEVGILPLKVHRFDRLVAYLLALAADLARHHL